MIEELFTYWNLDDADETLEELEDALIVSWAGLDWVGLGCTGTACRWGLPALAGGARLATSRGLVRQRRHPAAASVALLAGAEPACRCRRPLQPAAIPSILMAPDERLWAQNRLQDC